MRELIHKHTVSFINAFAGIRWSLSTQPNFRIHLTLSALAIFLCVYFRVTPAEWLIIVFTIILGLSAEMINTALEAMTDLITSEWRANAKIAKDVAAGMMLTVATGAAVVAAIVFLPYILAARG